MARASGHSTRCRMCLKACIRGMITQGDETLIKRKRERIARSIKRRT